jgi:hypothetical protein
MLLLVLLYFSGSYLPVALTKKDKVFKIKKRMVVQKFSLFISGSGPGWNPKVAGLFPLHIQPDPSLLVR